MGNLSGESSLSGALSIPTQMMPGTNNYNDLSNKPKINGVTLRGEQSSEDLGIKPGYDAFVDPTDDEHVILQF